MSAYPHLSDRPLSASLHDHRIVYRSSSRGSMNLESGGRPRSSALLPGSAGTLLDNIDDLLSTIQGLPTTRPSSSQSRYEMYALLSQSASVANPALSSTSSSFPLHSLFEKFNPSGQLTSHTLDLRIQKLIKSEKKVMKQQQDLIKDITSWCNILPNDDCKRLMYHFIKILEVEFDINEQCIKKQSQIIGQLGNVNKREKRTNDLKWKRNKILTKLRESENKVGDSPVTLLTKENLEELECSVEIVEDQFIRSVNNGLKNSLVDYILTLRNSGVKYTDSSKYFLDSYSFATKGDNSASNLQKLILLNKYNSNNNMTRDIPSSLGYNSSVVFHDKGKYPDNQIGEYDQAENLNTTSTEDHISTKGATGTGPTSSNHAGKTARDAGHVGNNTDDDSQRSIDSIAGGLESYNIINSYSTPGALTMLPGGTGHQWGS